MEKFFLKIDATTKEDNSIESHTEASINCTAPVAYSVLVNFFEKEEDLREMFEESLKLLKKKELADKIKMN